MSLICPSYSSSGTLSRRFQALLLTPNTNPNAFVAGIIIDGRVALAACSIAGCGVVVLKVLAVLVAADISRLLDGKFLAARDRPVRTILLKLD